MGFFTHFRAYGSLALGSALCLMNLSACQPKRDASPSVVSPIVAASEPRTTKIVLAEIEFLTQDLGCSSDADCVVQPVGTDGCGNGEYPYDRLIYSAPRTDVALLTEKIREFNFLQLQELESRGPPAVCSSEVLKITPSCDRATFTCLGSATERRR